MSTVKRSIAFDWSNLKISQKPIRQRKKHVEIDDETWRDGLQGTQVKVHPSAQHKFYYLNEAAKLGYIDHADIGFPASSREHFKEVDYIIRNVLENNLTITLSCAARASSESDILPIIELAKKYKYPLEADIFLDVSSVRAKHQGWDRKKMLLNLYRNVRLLKKEKIPVMFVPERATATPPDELYEAINNVLLEGADRICLPDTQGLADSEVISNIFRWAFIEFKKFRNVKWDFHGHNDLGLSLSNSLTAASEGIDRVHATAFCIGERSGNVDLAILLVNFNFRGFRKDNTTQILKYVDVASEILRFEVPSNYPIIGENAFDTASGVHASAYLAESKIPHSIYFPYNPDVIGRKSRMRVGPFSGQANVIGYAKQLGMVISPEISLKILDYAKNNLSLISEKTFRRLTEIE